MSVVHFSSVLFRHQTGQIRIFSPRLKKFEELWTSSPPLQQAGSDWQAARTEPLFQSRGPERAKGFFHRRTSAPWTDKGRQCTPAALRGQCHTQTQRQDDRQFGFQALARALEKTKMLTFAGMQHDVTQSKCMKTDTVDIQDTHKRTIAAFCDWLASQHKPVLILVSFAPDAGLSHREAVIHQSKRPLLS
ncbi:uncharacterized protein V6R79_006926 [Siganus canaliculatus]